MQGRWVPCRVWWWCERSAHSRRLGNPFKLHMRCAMTPTIASEGLLARHPHSPQLKYAEHTPRRRRAVLLSSATHQSHVQRRQEQARAWSGAATAHAKRVAAAAAASGRHSLLSTPPNRRRQQERERLVPAVLPLCSRSSVGARERASERAQQAVHLRGQAAGRAAAQLARAGGSSINH